MRIYDQKICNAPCKSQSKIYSFWILDLLLKCIESNGQNICKSSASNDQLIWPNPGKYSDGRHIEILETLGLCSLSMANIAGVFKCAFAFRCIRLSDP